MTKIGIHSFFIGCLPTQIWRSTKQSLKSDGFYIQSGTKQNSERSTH